MEADSCKEINVMFQTLSISEIKKYVCNLQKQIEAKRQEVRSTVGEKYRDLMDAADIIVSMKSNSSELHSSVEKSFYMSGELSQLPDLFSKPTLSEETWPVDDISVAGCIKVLIEIPEKLWNYIDGNNFLFAAQLFLFATNVHSYLNLQPHLNSRFPVISRQWAAVSHFQETILSACEANISLVPANLQHSCSAISALVLLQNTNSVQSIFDQYIERRNEALRNFLIQKDVAAVATDEDTIQQCLLLIVSTVSVVMKTFKNERLDELLCTSVISPLKAWSNFCETDFLVLQRLPPSLLNFLPQLNSTLEVDSFDVDLKIVQWLESLRELLKKHTEDALSRIASIKFISILKQSLISDWLPSLLLKYDWPTHISFDIWDVFYRPSFCIRVQKIISSKFEEIFEWFKMTVDSFDFSISNEADLSDYLWQSRADSSQIESMSLEYFSPSVQKLCHDLNSHLKEVFDDVSSYHDASSFDQGICKKAINMIETMIQYVSSFDKKAPGIKSRFFYFGRFYHALSSICPYLRNCLSETKWPHIREKLKRCGDLAIKEWQNILVHELVSSYMNTFQFTTASSSVWLTFFDAWDSVNIIEEELESVIYIPQYASPPLMAGIYAMATQTANAGAFELSLTLGQDATAAIEASIVNNIAIKLPQNVALQMLFDLRYLTLAFGSANKNLSGAQQFLENFVDPFDLKVFTPYVEARVVACVLRNLALITVLIPPEKFALFTLMKSDSTMSVPSNTNHNVLILSENTSIFPLLSLAKPTKPIDKSGISQTLPKSLALASVSKKSEYNAAPKSAAETFFGAMSSGWFGATK